MTPEINCEADVRHSKRNKEEFVTFAKENFRKLRKAGHWSKFLNLIL